MLLNGYWKLAKLNPNNKYYENMSTCLHPTSVHGRLFPCGQCPNCLQNKRQMLSSRFLLESAFCGGPTYFATLTYNDENIPSWKGYPCFDKKQVQNFVKRLRKIVPKFKMFLTSEYGDKTARPHYHMLLFFNSPINQFDITNSLQKEWKYGFVQCSLSNDNRVAYAAKYCLKDDWHLFKNLPNEDPRKPFRFFSSRPGLGSSAIEFINEYIYNDGNFRTEFKLGDKLVTFDNYIKNHIDPSLKAELLHLTYESNFTDIQERLNNQYVNNGEFKTDEFGKEYFVKDYTKDNEIRNHRRRLKKLKSNGF